MLYRSEEGRPPSLVVEEGQTFTVSQSILEGFGARIPKLRPLTTDALLVLAGMPSPTAPRLSDSGAFEEIDSIEGMVRLSQVDEDGRIDGYSVPYLRGVLEAIDPAERTPPKSVRRMVAHQPDFAQVGITPVLDFSPQNTEGAVAHVRGVDSLAQTLRDPQVTYSVRESFVPAFVAERSVFDYITRLGDVVVGRNATLILDTDISMAWADNFLAYQGSRIVQQANYLTLDISGTMRGGILDILHSIVSDRLTLDWQRLAAQPFTKP